MRLRIDRASIQLFEGRTESPATPNSDRRHYYSAQEPYRAILICRNGLELNDLAGQVVDALVGEERSERPFAREANVGQRHTLITLYGVLPDIPPEKTLAQVCVVPTTVDSIAAQEDWCR
jgi:hypothetical protein